MKYWRGYIMAAVFVAISWVLGEFAKAHTELVDMVYPYVTRIVQTTLADWTSGTSLVLWQLLVVVLGVLVLASVVVMIILKWNPFQWLGWVLAGASCLWMLHTGMYGLNNYAGPLADDIRLNVTSPLVSDIVEATTYFRDMANKLALEVPRDENGDPDYPTFEELAEMAGDGFEVLTYQEAMSVFAGSTKPVKKLEWADMYSSMGIAGVSMPLTGEAAVNPNIPAVGMPFTMCHEMAHRMCIALERDANLAAFLSCRANPDPIFQYSAYFMAYRYGYGALTSTNTSTADNAAKVIEAGLNDTVKKDIESYNAYLIASLDQKATDFANQVNDTYIKVSGDESGVRSYSEVCDLLISWYLQEIYLPAHQDEKVEFDPLDKNQVFKNESSGG